MKKYISFFKMRFYAGLQYRQATLGAIIVQLPWGFLECLAFHTFQKVNPQAFPMEFSAVAAYIWLKQAFFILFSVWGNVDQDVFDMILKGDVAYELCRPVSIYKMWFARISASRLAGAALRFLPVLAAASLLPKPLRFLPPQNIFVFFIFVVTMLLGVGVTVAFCMLVYITAFYTISPQGIRLFLMSVVEFLSGSIVPIPFMPDTVKNIVEWLPFAGMMNVPFRVYSGDLIGMEMYKAMGLQIFWLFVMAAAGMVLCNKAERRMTIQGG